VSLRLPWRGLLVLVLDALTLLVLSELLDGFVLDGAGAALGAAAAVGAMEHIGTAQLGAHFSAMAKLLRPEGRMLNHTITRTHSAQRNRPGPFIDRYVFPDGRFRPAAAPVPAPVRA